MTNRESINILLVEDILNHQRLYKETLEELLPVKVVAVGDGDQALQAVATDPAPDILILDLTIPKVNGERVLEVVRADHRLANMPVIILTARSETDLQLKLLEHGADDFVEKGSPPEIFVARVRAQMRRKVTLDRLAELAVSRDMFAAGVLHDIRNIESSITLGCELAKRQVEKDVVGNRDKVKQTLSTLIDQATKLGTYAHEIIQSVRATRKDPDMAPQDIGAIISWSLSIINEKEGLDATSRLTCNIGAIKPIKGDIKFLRLAMLNILQNAVKYRRPGVAPVVDITQSAPSLTGHGNRSMIVTHIRDNGVGIPKDNLKKVFEPFTRARGNEGEQGGFGLGLSLVSKVISMMGGRVWASEPTDGGNGTVINIELPAV